MLLLTIQATGKYVSEEYLRGRPAQVTAASSAEEDTGMQAVPMETILARRESCELQGQVSTI